MKLKNKNVLITGASSGIGKACAEAFAAEGANLILLARRSDKLGTLKDEINSKYSVKIHTIEADVRNYDLLKKSFNQLPAEFNNIDILINNAGLARGVGKIYDADLQDWEEMIDTNIKGLLYVSRIIIPKMIERNVGHIVNIGSIAGHEPYSGGSVYCGTKHAVRAITKAAAIDLNGTNIRVTEIDPGMVNTEFSEVRFHGDKSRADSVYSGVTPLYGEDIADIALFACTRKSSVMIQSILVTPTCQANATTVCRKCQALNNTILQIKKEIVKNK